MKTIPACEVHEIHENIVDEIRPKMLSQEEYYELSNIFKMFSDPTRLKILSALFQRELCVCDLVSLLNMTQSAVSHQLSVLRHNRIIRYRRSGKNIYYALDDEHIQHIYNAGLAHLLEESR